MDNYAYQDVVFVRGEGRRMWDAAGKAYLDCMGGMGSVSLGHGHPAVMRALTEQAARLTMSSSAFHTTPRTDCARFLVEHSCADRVCFANSGTEAVEAALKLARKWAYETKGPRANRFITFDGAYHGRSYGALSVTQKSRHDAFFGPYLPGVDFAPFGDLAAVYELAGDETAAIIIEPLQGDGGLHAADTALLAGLRAICDARDIALIFDEVQCGTGRMGTLFAYEHFGVEPDIIAVSKALGGGFPIGAMLARERFAQHFTPGVHGSTAAGSPLACAVALAVLETIAAPGFLEGVRACGAQLHAGLEAIARESNALQARGIGLMQGLDVGPDGEVGALRRALLEAGLVTTQAGASVVRFLPPLTVTEAEIDEALDITARTLHAST